MTMATANATVGKQDAETCSRLCANLVIPLRIPSRRLRFAIIHGRVHRLAVLVIALLVATAASGAVPTAKVRFVSANPATVRGSGFVARERVRLTLTAPGTKRTRVVRTSARGAFTVGFGLPDGFDRCKDGLLVTAVGGRGDRAGAKLPQPECPPVLRSP